MATRFFDGGSGDGLFGSRFDTEGYYSSTDDSTDGSGDTSSTDSTGDGGVSIASVSSGDGYYGYYAITAGTTGTGSVTIDSGAYTIDRLDSGVPEPGYAPTYGNVTITGAGTSVTVHDAATPGSQGPIRVGYYNPGGSGQLNVLDGASLTSINEAYYANGYIYGGFHNIRVGVGYNSYGKLVVSGAGSSLSMEGLGANATVGAVDGDGRLEVLAGATASFSATTVERPDGTLAGGYNNLHIGRDGGTGYALVSGAGSTLTTEGGAARIAVGRYGGTGTLRIENGGFVGTFDLDVGRGDTPTTGTLIVDGPGSTFLASADYGYYGSRYGGAQGYLDIGRGAAGRGYLTVSNGGTFTTQNVDGVSDFPFVRIARDNGSYGYGLVTGAGSSLNVVQIGPADESNYFGDLPGALLRVGDGGQGVLQVSNDAQVNVLGDQATLQVARGRDGAANTTTDQSQLLVNSGADVLIDSQGYAGAQLRIAQGAGTNGFVHVDGAGSTLTVGNDTDDAGDYATGRIDVGVLGYGRLDVTNAGAVASESLRVGVGSYAGYTGDGVVNIASGGTITVTNSDATPYSGVRIGFSAGATGVVNVDGAGSTLTSQGGSGRLQVGRYGTGDLNITNGGLANAFFLGAGQKDGSVGRVSIDGAGSRILVSDAYGSFPAAPGAAGAARFGAEAGGYGYLSITNGGQFDVINDPGYGYDNPLLRFGRDNGSVGVGVIDGMGSSANIVQTGPVGDYYGSGASLQVGNGGQGTLTVRNGAQVNVLGDDATLLVSGGRYTGGVPDTTTAQSQLHILSGADVLVDSQGYGSYTSGGLYRGAQVSIGAQRGTNGLVRVDGVGSTLTVTTDTDEVGDYQAGQISVGSLGRGQLDVSNGAAVFAKELQLGDQAARVDANTGQTTGLYFGYLANPDVAGYGIANITGGADVTITTSDNSAYRGVQLGRPSGSTGILNVDGTGSTLTSQGGTGRIYVGEYGTGQLNLSNGGQAFGFWVDVGRGTGSDGRITVDGAGSKLTVSDAYGHFPGFGGAYLGEAGLLQVGRSDGAYGYLGVSNGGVVEVINDPAGGYDLPLLQIARNNGSQGVAVVDGVGSTLTVAQSGPLGDYYGTLGPLLRVGNGGQGTLEARNGAAVNVLGAGAFLSVADGRSDAYGAPDNTTYQSLLSVTGGAAVLVDSQGYGGFQSVYDGEGYTDVFVGAGVAIGNGAATYGRAVVDGAGSTLTVTSAATPATDPASYLFVGNYGNGELEVVNGGKVENLGANGITAIGKEVGATGSATVSGTGSVLNAGTLLLIGASFDDTAFAALPDAGGTGTLTLAAGGEVMATDIIVGATGTVAGEGTLTGTVTLAGGTLSPGASPGTVNISGDLTVEADSTLTLEIDGFGAGEFDQVLVGGTADIDLAALDVLFPTASTFAAGSEATLVSAGDLTISSFTLETFLIHEFGAVPAEGATTLNGNLQAFLMADTGAELTVRALGPDGTNATGLADFGAGVTDGVVVETVNGFGTGSGGGFDAFALFGVSAILGTGGADIITMSATSAVTIDGGGGDDMLVAGAGDDVLSGGTGTDSLTGGVGADQFALLEGIGTDTVQDFQDGNDKIAVAGSTSLSDVSIVASGASDTEVLLASGDSLILVGITPSNITEADFVGLSAGSVIRGADGGDTLEGTTGDDLIEGGDGSDEAYGDAGGDTIDGGPGPDLLIGSDGDDTITGGAGRDQMLGSDGADTFVFEDGSGRDVILDWEDGLDKLDFSGHSAANALADLTISQVRSDTLIEFGSDSVKLLYVDVSEIDASDMIF